MAWLGDTLIASAAGAFGGAVGAWAIVTFGQWVRRPRLAIEYPCETIGTRRDGSQWKYVNIRVKNNGGSAARACKVFVRHIVLENADGQEIPLDSDFLMQANWAPREANVYSLDIPAGLDFFANILCEDAVNGKHFVRPMFPERLTTSQQFRDHVGVYRMSVVVVSDNSTTVERTIQARFNGKPLGLFAEA